MSRIGGNIGRQFQQAKNEIAAAAKEGRAGDVFDSLLKLLTIRERTRLKRKVDNAIVAGFKFYQDTVARATRSNQPDSLFEHVARQFSEKQDELRKVPGGWEFAGDTLVKMLKPTQLDFFADMDAVRRSLQLAMEVVADQPKAAEAFAAELGGKLDMNNPGPMYLALGNYGKTISGMASVDNLVHHFIYGLLSGFLPIWSAAHHHQFAPALFDRKFGDLIATLNKTWPEDTQKVLAKFAADFSPADGNPVYPIEERRNLMELVKPYLKPAAAAAAAAAFN